MPGRRSREARILTVEIDPESRQIGSRTRLTELLNDRKSDIHAAIEQAVEILKGAASQKEDESGWRVSTIDAKFGIVLTAEAGVIISKASAEASLEVSITVENR